MASSTFKKDAPIVKRQTFSYRVASIAGNTGRRVTASELGFAIPDGYQPFACAFAGSTDTNCYLYGFSAVQGYVDIKNTSSTAKTNVTVALIVSFIREDFFEAL